jgi:hypothetical protein
LKKGYELWAIIFLETNILLFIQIKPCFYYPVTFVSCPVSCKFLQKKQHFININVENTSKKTGSFTLVELS